MRRWMPIVGPVPWCVLRCRTCRWCAHVVTALWLWGTHASCKCNFAARMLTAYAATVRCASSLWRSCSRRWLLP
jgi:hypothetical protein